MSFTVHKRLNPPRAGIVGFDKDSAAELAELVTSPVIAGTFLELSRPWDELDLVVAAGPPYGRVPWNMPVLYRSRSRLEGRTFVDSKYTTSVPGILVHYTDSVEVVAVSQESDGLSEAIDRLARSSPDEPHQFFSAADTDWTQRFLLNPRGEVLAGEYEKDDGMFGWILPHWAADLSGWMRLFLQRLHQADAKRVPVPPPLWVPWLTAEETRLGDALAEVRGEFDAVAAQYFAKAKSLEEDRTQAAELAKSGHQRLLTSDGDELKEAVMEALAAIGFAVTDVDATLDEGEGKREDLWITVDNEVCICEVKGYTRGAKTSDMMKTKDYVATYMERQGSRPSRQWHVVNAFRNDDPNTRPRVFDGHDDLVAVYGGVVIDSRFLFKLVRDVELEVIADEKARDLLWQITEGRVEY